MTESEILCECDAIEAMCGVAGAVGATPVGGFNIAAILQLVATIRAAAAFIKEHPEIQALAVQVIAMIKAFFGPQPTPTPDNGVV